MSREVIDLTDSTDERLVLRKMMRKVMMVMMMMMMMMRRPVIY